MAINRPVLCKNCGAQIRKTGYCSSCGLHIKVVAKAHNTSDYHYNIALDKAKSRDLSGAVESLNVSLRYNKKNIFSRNLLGLIYYETGEFVAALSEWVISANYKSDNNVATKYLKELRNDNSIMGNEDQVAKKYNMALAYAMSEDYDLGIMQLKGAISLNAHFVKGYLLLALLYIRQNNYEKARVTIRRILKIDRANPLAIHYLHEMGENQSEDVSFDDIDADDGLLDTEFMEEASITEDEQKTSNKKISPIRDIIEKHAANSVKTGEFGEIRFAKYSGMYVLLGLIIGILLFSFFVLPGQKKKLRNKNDQMIKSYSEELAAKNATITSLQTQIDELMKADEVADSGDTANAMPDFSQIENGMSEEDINDMIMNE